MEQDWIARQTKTVGKRVAFYRQRATDDRGRKLTAQDLADRCKDLGLPIGRPAIAKLESGFRQSISVAEIQVLARALDVAPVLLLFPLGYAETAEVLPGLHVDPYTAIEWFSGQITEPVDGPVQHVDVFSPMLMWGEHLNENDLIKEFLHEAQAADADEASLIMGRIETIAAALRRVRQAILDRGMVPPGLHPETARILREEAPDGPR